MGVGDIVGLTVSLLELDEEFDVLWKNNCIQ